jgi:hypothetical protein
MRKFLMASAATLGAVGIVGAASAQTAPIAPQLEGQVLTAPGNYGGANNNNNYQGGPALPGSIAIPTPGTFVIHLNGRVFAEAGLASSSFNSYTQGAATGAGATGISQPGLIPAGAPLGTTSVASFGPAAGTYKQNPQSFLAYVRLYPGVDAMATNGLRYGASVEIRENWSSTTPSGGNVNSTSSSGQTSSQTLMIRRDFVYAAGDQWGIVRFGQADSVMGIFDNGVTTFQNASINGGMNGTDGQTLAPGNTSIPFPFMAQNGIDYGRVQFVYLTPQFAGFDIGFDYAPNNTNGEQNGLCSNGATSDPSALGVSGVNAAQCTTLSSSPLASDASRYINAVQIGARYQGTFGPVSLLAHATYMASGTVDYTGAHPSTAANAGNPNGWNGKYNGYSFGQGGVALTIAGLTFGGAVNAGADNNNGQVSLQPQGGVQQKAFILGAQYVIGPLTVGAAYEHVDSQGAANLVGVTQRREWGMDVEGMYTVAPGNKVFAAYTYNVRHQSDFSFATSGVGTGAYNEVKMQTFLIGDLISW